MVHVNGSFEEFGSEDEYMIGLGEHLVNGYTIVRKTWPLFGIYLNGKRVGTTDEVHDNDNPFYISLNTHERPDLLTFSL